MLDASPRKVLLAVRTPDCEPAVGAASAEAVRRGVGVHVVHVVHPLATGRHQDSTLTVISGELRHRAVLELDAAAERVRSRLPDDWVVTTELGHGAVSPVLTELSEHACLVVMQRRDRARHHVAPLSFSSAVAARAAAPTLVVPESWPGDPDGATGAAPVAVGLHADGSDVEVVRAALEEAAGRGVPLRLLHGRGHPASVDPDDPGNTRLREQIVHALEDVLAVRPQVPVEVVVTGQTPVEALLDTEASLLVVGRRHGSRPIGPHLGSVARGLLRHADRPVLVVDPVNPAGT